MKRGRIGFLLGLGGFRTAWSNYKRRL